MFIREEEKEIKLPEGVFEKYNMGNIVYFDIETTGFDKEKDHIILISAGVYKDMYTFSIKQYFCENLEEETQILKGFKEFLTDFDIWCSYNGIAFDEPFIKQRMSLNNIIFDPPSEHIDLYRMIRPYYKQLGMERCNLKSVERHIGVERQDKIDGGMSVELYYEYLDTRNEEIMKTILLHNYEDVLHLPLIFNLIDYVKGNTEIIREDCITEKQLKFLKSLMKKNKIELDIDIERISKKSASKLIDSILSGNNECSELLEIVYRYD